MVPPALTRLAKTVHAFAVETRGVFLPIAGFMLLILIVVAGAGTDFGRAILIRARVAAAVDAAVLAVARDLSVKIMTDAEISDVLNKSFQSNLTSLNLEGVSMGNLVYTIDPVEGTVEATATANVPTTFIFMGGIGPKTIPVSVTAQSTYSLFDVELAMIVDVTGSMSPFMVGLRQASQAIVDILLPAGPDPDELKVRISLTPYSEGVNMGSFAARVTNNNQGSRNCVTERDGPMKYTDATFNYDGNASEFFGGGSNSCASTPQLEPLTNNRNTLTTAISRLTASGGTAGQTGITLGWYTIAPTWNNLWNSANRAEPYGRSKLQKIALIMTDGDFNVHYYKQSLTQAQCQNIRNNQWDGLDIIVACQSGTRTYWIERSVSGFNASPSQIARSTCDAMKAKNIRMYTVYFGSAPTSAGARVMQYCATDSSTYFNATNSEALISAFQKIANQIQSIYLSK
ncbi:pilus assembly protein TadG-related protein [Pannonibacter tanglangensis]|uniref:Pilus assembly protein TadG n=1 Tax=Pannonibacter tanglangensis TaxID=2750084 RepID=A0ABW9ZRJ5_9HYPH|nr:pilus assembly protein TadG-related protein [Pannonibacter sp. XCT-34]NBN65579.1 pilus assembly protein TadG [Pannonibacter sp. XCT-34]